MHISFKEYRRLLTTYLGPQIRQVVILMLLLCSSICLQLVNPQILGMFINTVATRGSTHFLLLLAGLFIGLALLQQAGAVGATYFSERIAWTSTNALRADLAQHLLYFDLSFHKKHTPGELIERVDGDVTVLANFFSQFVIQILGNLLLVLGILIVLWSEHWTVGLSLSAFALVVLFTTNRLRALAIPYWNRYRQASADLFGFLEECLGGTEDIRSCGAQPYTMNRLYIFMRERLRAGRIARIMASIPWGVPMLAFVIGNVIAFALAIYLYHVGTVSIGAAFLIYYYVQLMFQPLNLISNQIDDFQKASAGIIRVNELLSMQSALQDGTNTIQPVGALPVAFEHVTFSYDGDETVLHDISFSLRPGEVLGLLGRTGSGKTTLTRLLFRLYDPTAGTIYLGETDIRKLRLADLQQHIGLVTQDVQIFHATVRDNLTFFDHSIDDSRIMQAFTDLELLQWYHKLPEGLDTMLSSEGGGLSAGEAQLLAFTRIFLKNPSLIVLDEASSRLDPATEQLIERAITRLLQNRTGIIIAHRLDTVQRADTIMILNEGSICEYGPRQQLIENPDSQFSRLLRTSLEEVLR